MRVQIRDQEALGSLTPENLRAYLESQGWGNDRPWGQWGTILSKEQKGKLWEIVIPLRDGGYGYAEFMGLMVATLADAEDRSQLDVFYDLSNQTAGAEASSNDKLSDRMTKVWCVRSGNGKYTQHFVDGSFFGYGWDWPDLTTCKDQNEVREMLASKVFAQGTSISAVGQYAGMAARVMWEIQEGDWVITPEEDSRFLRYGKVEPGGCCYIPNAPDGCPDTLRRSIVWEKQPLLRDTLSMPLQYNLRAARSVFAVEPAEDFLVAIGQMSKRTYESIKSQGGRADRYGLVLNRIYYLNADDTEFLVKELLKAMGFEDTEITGQTNDGGVDVTGQISVPGLATVKVFVQVKRYKAGKKISANTVKNLRASIPMNAQGAFFTTAGYAKGAFGVASEVGFPPINLIDGRQLVDLIIQYRDNFPEDFLEKIGLGFVLPQA